MSKKLHHCSNGEGVTEQVMKFRTSRTSYDYIEIQKYYNEFKEQWYKQISDYMDRATFDGEFDFKLIRAIETFNEPESTRLANKHGWSDAGRFNRWFFKILTNWKSNVKNSSFRLKKRPSVQCPICQKSVGRIDQEHLDHFKTVKDLPRFFVLNEHIYETCSLPKAYSVTWGESTPEKLQALRHGDAKSISASKKKIKWPWKSDDGKKVVVCPFTKKQLPEITDDYIRTLPKKFNRYAEAVKWNDFVERFPYALIQSEMYSLDHSVHSNNEQVYLRDHVSQDNRIEVKTLYGVDYRMICRNDIPVEYEHVFHSINTLVKDDVDRDVLKLVSSGYSIADIAETLDCDIKEIKTRLKNIRSNHDLEKILLNK